MSFSIKTAPRVFVDIETTGLDNSQHEILEIAIIHESGEEWTTKIQPEDLASADPKALEVNGFSMAEWQGAPTLEEVGDTIIKKLSWCVPVAHNAGFDKGFILACLQANDFDTRNVGYHWLDTVSFAYEHLVPKGLTRLSLASVCSFLDISNEGAHRALADARRCKAVYEALCPR